MLASGCDCNKSVMVHSSHQQLTHLITIHIIFMPHNQESAIRGMQIFYGYYACNCFKILLFHTHTANTPINNLIYQVFWMDSRAQSSGRIPVWLRWRLTVSQDGRGSAGRCCLQLRRFLWLQKCGWWRAVLWLHSVAGEFWHHSDEPSESLLWAESEVFTDPDICKRQGTAEIMESQVTVLL